MVARRKTRAELGSNPKGRDPTDLHVGSRVLLRRQVLGLSQSAVAEALGVTFQQVQKYERGANRISASRLAALAEYMKVTPTFFFEGQTGEHPTFGTPSDYVTEMLATADGLALIGAFQKLK